MGLVARVVPASSMGPLKTLIRTILSTHSRVLTFGILLTLWSASSGFTALIDALNTAYNVSETGVTGRRAVSPLALLSRLDVCSSWPLDCRLWALV
jgi:uncharacterized BrkB/YihY/UPF0761 family membrane protein